MVGTLLIRAVTLCMILHTTSICPPPYVDFRCWAPGNASWRLAAISIKIPYAPVHPSNLLSTLHHIFEPLCQERYSDNNARHVVATSTAGNTTNCKHVGDDRWPLGYR